MENSMGLGLMTVFAVSGSMVLLVHQVHKHLLNNFMKKFECEIRGVLYPHHPTKSLSGSRKHQRKKVRFAEHVLELPMEENEKVLDKEDSEKWRRGGELKDRVDMPSNRVALYRGILKYRGRSLDF